MNAIAREVAARIEEELDYRTEAAHQAEFAAAYRGHPFIRIPEIIPELSTRRVLTMELAGGKRWPQALTASQALRDRWGEVIYRFAVGSLCRLRMVNADPQPGNYLFHDDGAVTFLDFGCVKHYTSEQITALQSAAQATVDGDAQALCCAGSKRRSRRSSRRSHSPLPRNSPRRSPEPACRAPAATPRSSAD